MIIAGQAAGLFGLGVNPLIVILLAALEGWALLESQGPASRPEADPARVAPTTKPLLFLLAAVAAGFFLLYLTQPVLFELAALMFRIDLFAFGGGYASVPLMFHEIVEARGWLDGSTFLDAIVLGQITPGPIVITATFVGFWLYGLPGGVIATVSVFLPSFMLVVGLVPYFDRLRASRLFNRIIDGILCSFVGLLLTVTLRFAGNVQWDVLRLVLVGAAFIALRLKVDILWVVAIGATVSVLAMR